MKYEGEMLSVFFAAMLAATGFVATDDVRLPQRVLVIPAAGADEDCPDLYCGRDYPAAARAARQQGLVQAVVGADFRGRPERCWVSVGSGHPALDAATCTLLLARGSYPGGRAMDRTPRRVRADYYVDWRLDAAIPSDPQRRPLDVPETRSRRN